MSTLSIFKSEHSSVFSVKGKMVNIIFGNYCTIKKTHWNMGIGLPLPFFTYKDRVNGEGHCKFGLGKKKS
jgi:hypothetical protein